MAKRITWNDLADATQLAPKTAPHIYRLDDKTVVKVGDSDRLSEAATMRFVRSRTSIPIPLVYDVYLDKNCSDKAFLLMEYVEGDVLRDVWDTMPSIQQQGIMSQLRDYLQELRLIKGTIIGSVGGSSCKDQLFERDQRIYGPYENETMFNEGIIDAIKAISQDVFIDMVADMVRAMPKHEIVLTHSDITPRNIIVRDGKIVAILDWELGGFYPEYWEYVKALYMPDWDDNWVKERITDKILEPYHIEHAVMRNVHEVNW